MVKPRVLCIMGVGHSGSTVLGIALGNHDHMETIGEFYKLPRSGWTTDDSRRCSCGEPIHQCSYWQEIQSRWACKVAPATLDDYIRLQNMFERSRYVWPRLLIESTRRSLEFNDYLQMTAAVYEAIQEVSGKSIIVDTSKAPVRNYALLLNNHIDARVIHLVRDGRGVVWSQKKPRQKDVAAGIPRHFSAAPAGRTSRDWLLTNLECEWVRASVDKSRSLRVLYEHFVEDPCVVLKQIEQLASEDLTQLATLLASGQALRVGHLVGGNQLRMKSQIVLRSDAEWKIKLPPDDQQIFWRSAGWLAQRYGYQA